MVENQPVSLDGATGEKPLQIQGLDQTKSSMAMVVGKVTNLLTALPSLADRRMGLPSTLNTIRLKSRRTYLLGAYVLAG